MSLNWRRQHKWSSLAATFFLITLCLSGILLNHRNVTDTVSVSRSLLLPFYHYHDWNLGLMRGTLPTDIDSTVIIYGNSGIWLHSLRDHTTVDFNKGIPSEPCARQILSVKRYGGKLLALSPGGLYVRTDGDDRWHPLAADDSALDPGERMSDMTTAGDTLLLTGRSNLYAATGGTLGFRKITLSRPDEEGFGKTTLFRTVWSAHSGELFGLPGRLVADSLALVLTALCLTGLTIWLLPKLVKRRAREKLDIKNLTHSLKLNIRLHRKLGYWTVAFTLLICLTGWLLRPPFLLALVHVRTSPPPGSTLRSDNPWNDKLRMARHDGKTGRWLLLTSEGTYALEKLKGNIHMPQKMASQPPVSVMGPTVFEEDADGKWIVGSFSGMYNWSPSEGNVTDWFTGEKVTKRTGAPFGKKAISGFSRDLGNTPAAVLYDKGTTDLSQPEEMRYLPMSLWQVALETHTGRIFFGNAATWFYITVIGGVVLWCLISGFAMVRCRRKNHRGRISPRSQLQKSGQAITRSESKPAAADSRSFGTRNKRTPRTMR